ncbi:MAG: hypothetical protein ACRCZF_21675 [Gemmataceae bacterium]
MNHATLYPSPNPDSDKNEMNSDATSLAFNKLIYIKNTRFPDTITDGTSQTFLISQHYAYCDNALFDWRAVLVECCVFPAMTVIPCDSNRQRTATFSDGVMFKDVVPVTTVTGNSPITVGSDPVTFQSRPLLSACDPRLLQSTYDSGLLVGYADGSVRSVRKEISASAFWSQVTPNRGEVVPND